MMSEAGRLPAIERREMERGGERLRWTSQISSAEVPPDQDEAQQREGSPSEEDESVLFSGRSNGQRQSPWPVDERRRNRKRGTYVLRSTQPMTCRPPFTPLAALNNLVRVALSQPLCSTRSPRTARPWLMSASSCDSALSTNASSLSAYSADVDGPRWGLLVVYCD